MLQIIPRRALPRCYGGRWPRLFSARRILGGASFAKPAPETGRAWRWIMWWSAALCVALTFASPAARAGALEDCSQNQDVDLKIKGCTINISTRPGDREFLPACFAEPSS